MEQQVRSVGLELPLGLGCRYAPIVVEVVFRAREEGPNKIHHDDLVALRLSQACVAASGTIEFAVDAKAPYGEVANGAECRSTAVAAGLGVDTVEAIRNRL